MAEGKILDESKTASVAFQEAETRRTDLLLPRRWGNHHMTSDAYRFIS